jgi:hypothetical protein
MKLKGRILPRSSRSTRPFLASFVFLPYDIRVELFLFLVLKQFMELLVCFKLMVDLVIWLSLMLCLFMFTWEVLFGGLCCAFARSVILPFFPNESQLTP